MSANTTDDALSQLMAEFREFVENMQSMLETHGEDHVFQITEEFLQKGVYHAQVDTPFYTRFSKSRDFAVAAALHNQMVAAGTAIWTQPQQQARAQAIERGTPPILLITLPKSGSLYLSGVIGTVLHIPHIQISLRRFPNDYPLTESIRLFARGGSIAQTHMDAMSHNLDALADAGIRRIHVHVRDPRQVTVSWAHFYRARMSGPNAHLRHLIDPYPPPHFDDMTHEQQIEWHAHRFYPACLRWIVQWVVAAEHDPRFEISFTDHAQLQSDRLKTICAILQSFDCASDFIAGVPDPQANKFHYRQGGNEEWRNVMTPATQRLVNGLLPSDLKQRFGWPEA